ncbi:hypothetical protein D9758_004165 [Tetrapyrgos nigripes]|uniref:Uncharacterized protein n=1 Tax=Tetrapyrgos nigripes TaxID=182062 RepID=A0A8H5GUV2_9AGAR|nr:hypothetical protein D9758_004165 [Tetrapyrgos nigripes]
MERTAALKDLDSGILEMPLADFSKSYFQFGMTDDDVSECIAKFTESKQLDSDGFWANTLSLYPCAKHCGTLKSARLSVDLNKLCAASNEFIFSLVGDLWTTCGRLRVSHSSESEVASNSNCAKTTHTFSNTLNFCPRIPSQIVPARNDRLPLTLQIESFPRSNWTVLASSMAMFESDGPVAAASNGHEKSINSIFSVEILTEILSWCSPSLCIPDKEGNAVEAFTLVLSQINLLNSVNEERELSNLLDLYLDRSSPALLDVKAYDYNDNGRDYFLEEEQGQLMLRSLLDADSRWHTAVFNLANATITEIESCVGELTTTRQQSRLESLSTPWDEEISFEDDRTTFFHLFQSTPALSFLYLDHWQVSFPLCCDKLTAIQLYWAFPSQLASLFGCCPRLESVDMEEYGASDDSSDTEIPAITSKTLRSLTIPFSEFDPTANAISAFDLPALTHLHISFDVPSGISSLSAIFKRVLARSSYGLQKLKLEGPVLKSDEPLDLLRLLTELTHLIINARQYHHFVLGSNALLEQLVLGPTAATGNSTGSNETNILPQLQNLHIEFCDFRSSTEAKEEDSSFPQIPNLELLYQIAASRVAPVNDQYFGRFKHLGFRAEVWFRKLESREPRDKVWKECIQAFSSDTAPRLRVLEKEGLGLSLSMKCMET